MIERNASDGCDWQIRLLRLQVVALPSDRRRRAGFGTGGRILPALSTGAAGKRRRRLADNLRQRLVRRIYRQGRGVLAGVAGRAGALATIFILAGRQTSTPFQEERRILTVSAAPLVKIGRKPHSIFLPLKRGKDSRRGVAGTLGRSELNKLNKRDAIHERRLGGAAEGVAFVSR